MRVQIRFQEPKFTKKAISEYLNTPQFHIDVPGLFDFLEPTFEFGRYGLQATSAGEWDQLPEFFKERGKFNAEGTNHVHLDGIVSNPVAQFKIGALAIKLWNTELKALKGLERVVIYLHSSAGTRTDRFTMCAYSNPKKTDLERLEGDWGTELRVTSYSQFQKWLAEVDLTSLCWRP